MEICIERPQKNDFEELHKLFLLAIGDAFKQDGIDDNEGVQEEVKKQLGLLNLDFDTKGSEVFFLIARIEEKIVGTIAYSRPNDLINNNLQVDDQNMPEVTSVYVHPEFQGKGVGSLLFNGMLISLLHKNNDVFCLDGGYKKSQNFWIKKLGNPTITLKDYWGKGLHHMIWLRNLKDLKIKYEGR